MNRLLLLLLSALLLQPCAPAQDLPARRAAAEALADRFWQSVWNPPYQLESIDALLTPDFVGAGRDQPGRPAFKEWVRTFQSKIGDLRLEPLETFANEAGTRVVTRWRLTGRNLGVLGTPADGRAIELSGISIWEVRDGRLARNWVERSAYELWQQLTSPPKQQ